MAANFFISCCDESNISFDPFECKECLYKASFHIEDARAAHNIAINEATGYAFTIGNSAGGET